MRTAIYARVSTDTQTTENQLLDLRQTGQRLGWDVVHTFVDDGISGSKGRDKRPAFDEMLRMVHRRDIDLIAAWSVDRLSRSLSDLVRFMDDLRARDIGLYLHQQNLDTTSPSGRAMLGLLGVFSEFELATTRARVIAGQARARADGKRIGRPRLQGYKVKDVRKHLNAGMSIRQTANLVGCSVGAVHRIKQEQMSNAPS